MDCRLKVIQFADQPLKLLIIKMVLILVVLVLITLQSVAQDNNVQIRQEVVDRIGEENIWKDLQPKYSNMHNEIHLITGKFYDEHLVSRWSSKWLANDTVWVIGITKQIKATNTY